MKIALFALDNISNGGDEMLGDTVEYLIRKAVPDCEICRYQLSPLLKDVWRYAPVCSFVGAVLLKIARCCSGNFRHRLFDFGFNIKYRAYYEHCLRHADKAVYAVGMLKFTTQDFSHVYKLINRIASRRGIDVLMNAMSIARANKQDIRYAHLVEAVNEKCVKMVTTRDGNFGLERLRHCYVTRNDIVTDYVGDPALWAPECYGVKKKAPVATGKLRLGINLIRSTIYESYNGGMKRDAVYAFYKELITAAREQFDVTLFCNGIYADYIEGVRLVKELELPGEILSSPPLIRTRTDRNHFRVRCRFRRAVTRLPHFCGIEHSCGRPSVG